MYFRREFERNSDSNFCNGRKKGMKQEKPVLIFFQEATNGLLNKWLAEVTEC